MQAIEARAISSLSVDQLTGRLHELRREERHRLVELLRYLGELERRQVLPELGFSGTFAFCTEMLGYTRSAAFRRTTAARLLARFPVVGDYLADGRLCLTTLVELRDVLEPERLDEILARAAGKTEDEVKVLVAALRPRPAPPDLLRRLPARPVEATPVVGPSAGAVTTVEPAAAPGRAGSMPPAIESAAPSAGPAPTGTSSPARIEPIAEDRFVLRVTVDAAFVADLQALRAALSHKVPAGGLADLLRECVRQTLKTINRRKKGAPRTATTEPEAKASPAPKRRRAVGAAIRVAVWARDEHRCAFVAASGRRCNSTHRLELHHIVPWARGGTDTIENLSLRCRVHNRHAAVQDFGEQVIERARAHRRMAGGALLFRAPG